MKKCLYFVLIVVMAFSTAAMAAQEKPGKRMVFKGLKELNLTPQQKQQLKEILRKYESARKSAADTSLAAKETLAKAVHADVLNEAKVREAHKQVSSHEEELAVIRAKRYSEFKAILTPQQVQVSKRLLEQRIEKTKERREAAVSKFENWLDSEDADK